MTSLPVIGRYLGAGLYPSTFADPRFRKEDSVFVTNECSPGRLGAKSLNTFAISTCFTGSHLRNAPQTPAAARPCSGTVT